MEKKTAATNRKAYHNYEILETLEAGIMLAGHEVKSVRAGHINLSDGYVTFRKEEPYLANVHISQYSHQSTNIKEYEPTRQRKLLLHKQQAHHMFSKIREKGLTLVPLEVFFSKSGYAKVLLGLGKGKNVSDKREQLKKKSIKREMQREMAEKGPRRTKTLSR